MRTITPATCTAIILNYNGYEDTLACLHSIEMLQSKPRRIIVVDNGSPNNSVQMMLQRWPKKQPPTVITGQELIDPNCLPKAEYILLTLAQNCGYAAGNNRGICLAMRDTDCNALWILNNDTELDQKALEHLCDSLNDDAEAGIAGSTQVYTGTDIVQCAGGASINRWLGSTRSLKEACKLHDILQCAPQKLNSQ